ncbi:hypothetical protein L198_01723 [Cryptococcus wingfieldii CBS 7118]|uniref:Protein SMG7 n=1 Tax=Cryptococcus wingfieldii CBS 7118 TaxID=1295528 RepID=A0A1E3K0E0_9TREE|nr:hypothetical protein L198_01723 [Cryptococcus wingfieldii CBS 7118]ODO06491.1 hypothetical protein L198_01723 [Cryptococcus wingfieldii CBS 7118]
MQSPQDTGHSAASIDREAKAHAEDLKSLLANSHFPWSKDVEAAQKQCRNAHLKLIFHHPLSPYSQSLDPLWLHTTYALIQSYRDVVAGLERVAQSQAGSPVGNGGGRGGRRKGGGGGGAGGDVKKALTRFRQVLASEETFYRSIVARIASSYELGEISGVASVLKQVKLPVDISSPHEASPLYEDASPLARRGSTQSLSLAEKKTKLGLLYKGLICLGDLERYREQYKAPINGAGRRAQERVREGGRFEAAGRYYTAAWSLLPDDGSAWNQLAVISTYIPSDFSTAYYYIRALSVRQAFRGAEEILQKFFSRMFDRGRIRWKEEDPVERENGMKGVDDSLKDHLSSRHLPTETIVQLTALLIGVHFRNRSTAGVLPTGNPVASQDPKVVKRSYEAEGKALEVMLRVWTVYFLVATEEVRDASLAAGGSLERSALDDRPVDGAGIRQDEMPQLISAVLRRNLPSLRLISKWLKLNSSYLSRLSNTRDSNLICSTNLTTAQGDFERQYEAFLGLIGKTFPLDRLPSLEEALEEDIDMRGFLGLVSGSASGGSNGLAKFSAQGQTSEQGILDGRSAEREVHPNEEHLMRLSDLQVDGKLILSFTQGHHSVEPQPLDIHQSSFSIPDATTKAYPALTDLPHVSPALLEQDDLGSISTNTEDDPVTLAMRASLGEHGESELGEGIDDMEDDDDEEVIVWGRGSNAFAQPPSQSQGSFLSNGTPQALPSLAPLHQPPYTNTSQSLSAQHSATHQPKPQLHNFQQPTHATSSIMSGMSNAGGSGAPKTAADLLHDLLEGGVNGSVSPMAQGPLYGQTGSPFVQHSPGFAPLGGFSRSISMSGIGLPSPHPLPLPNGPAGHTQHRSNGFPQFQPPSIPQHSQQQSQQPFMGAAQSGGMGMGLGSIWTMTREESGKGQSRGWDGVAAGNGTAPPPGFGLNAPQPPGPYPAPTQPQPQVLPNHQQISMPTSRPSTTLQAQVKGTYRPSPSTNQPSKQAGVQTTRQPTGPPSSGPMWGGPGAAGAASGSGAAQVTMPLPSVKAGEGAPYYMRPGVFGSTGSGIASGPPGLPAVAVGGGLSLGGSGGGIWDSRAGTKEVGNAQGWV